MTQFRVGIIDDDPSVGRAISRLLKSFDLIPEVYCSGASLLIDIDRAFDMDCLILDLEMPGISGLDVIECLSQAGVNAPVVVLTAHDAAEARNACLSAGAAAYLHKPVEADRLLTCIHAAIKARSNPWLRRDNNRRRCNTSQEQAAYRALVF